MGTESLLQAVAILLGYSAIFYVGSVVLAFSFARVLFTEPTGNVPPRIAGERYEGGKLVDVPRTMVVALDCSTQGFPVPVTRYTRD